MKLQRSAIVLTLALVAVLAGCKSKAERARILEEQQKLDAVEQKRTEYAGAISCRRVTDVALEKNSVPVDKSHCSAEQMKLEEDAEKQQREEMFGKIIQENADKYQAVFDKMRRGAAAAKSPQQ